MKGGGKEEEEKEVVTPLRKPTGLFTLLQQLAFLASSYKHQKMEISVTSFRVEGGHMTN